MNKFCRTILLFSCLAVWLVPAAFARLDGVAEWGYVNYEQDSDSAGQQEASHFTQRYSLMYRTQGLLAGGRAGGYDLGAGVEWAAFDTDLDGEQISKDAMKLLYEGRFLFAPGALPFRLNAYSYDLNKVTFGHLSHAGLLNSNIVTDLYNGQTIVSGVQLQAGTRNGAYLSKYREILSQWPRLLIDYRDVYRRDLKARVPQEYRDQNLAFVSLNKKDNWFHYRVRTHVDYQNSINDERESTIMLGTIDHLLKRQWIDLTNWIRISVDGSYTETEQRWDSRKTNRFDINFFTIMQRSDFSVTSLPNMQRVRRGDTLEQTFDLPVYAQRRLNLETNLRSKFEYWSNDISQSSLVSERSQEAYHANVSLETNRLGRAVVVPNLEMEIKAGDVGEGHAIRAKVESYTNPLRRKNFDWYTMTSLARFSGASNTDKKTSLWEGELKGGVNYRLGKNMKLGGQQSLLYGTGTYDSQSTHFMRSAAASGFGRNSDTESQVDEDSLFRSRTDLYFEHTSPSRIANRFQVRFEFQESDTQRLYNLELSHRLNYQSQWWRVTLDNLYVLGDNVSYDAPGSNNLGVSLNGGVEGQFQHRASVQFLPNIYWQSKLEALLYWGEDSTGQKKQLFQANQSVQRTYFVHGAQRRKRGQITQSLRYEQYQAGNDDRQSIAFTLAGEYYATTYWRLGMRTSYYLNDFANDALYYSLTSGLDFPKFKVDFSYQYGAQKEDKIVAHRYEVNVKKTF